MRKSMPFDLFLFFYLNILAVENFMERNLTPARINQLLSPRRKLNPLPYFEPKTNFFFFYPSPKTKGVKFSDATEVCATF